MRYLFMSAPLLALIVVIETFFLIQFASNHKAFKDELRYCQEHHSPSYQCTFVAIPVESFEAVEELVTK